MEGRQEGRKEERREEWHKGVAERARKQKEGDGGLKEAGGQKMIKEGRNEGAKAGRKERRKEERKQEEEGTVR